MKFIISRLKNVIPEEELQSQVFLRALGVNAWVSFLCAALASILFFASFEPTELATIATFPAELSAIALYSIGFLLFWMLGFVCSTFSYILLALPLTKRQKSLPDPLHDDVE